MEVEGAGMLPLFGSINLTFYCGRHKDAPLKLPTGKDSATGKGFAGGPNTDSFRSTQLSRQCHSFSCPQPITVCVADV